MKKFLGAVGDVWQVVRSEKKYRAILLIFLVTVFYNVVIVPDEKDGDKVKKDKVEDVYVNPDLDRKRESKIYRDIIDAGPGDWYRVFVRAVSLKDEKVDIFAQSDSGAKQFLGTINLTADTWSENEFVVRTNGLYENILLTRQKEQDGDRFWYENKVVVDELKVSRIDIASGLGVQSLSPTMYNKPEFKSVLISAQDNSVALSKKGQQFCAPFTALDSRLSHVGMKLKHAGDGGKGSYMITIERAMQGDNTETRLLVDQEIRLANITKYSVDERDYYQVFMPTMLEQGEKYFVCIDNKDAQVNGSNHLVLDDMVESDNQNELFELSYIAVGDDDLLIGTQIEDRGSAYRMKYNFSGNEEEVFNVFATNKGFAKYSENKKAVFIGNNRDAFIDYKINTKYPFDSIYNRIKLNGGVSKYTILYSYDYKLWQEIDSKKMMGEYFEFTVTQPKDATAQNYIFVRIKSKRDSRKTKGKIEVRDFEVTAYMNKLQ